MDAECGMRDVGCNSDNEAIRGPQGKSVSRTISVLHYKFALVFVGLKLSST